MDEKSNNNNIHDINDRENVEVTNKQFYYHRVRHPATCFIIKKLEIDYSLSLPLIRLVKYATSYMNFLIYFPLLLFFFTTQESIEKAFKDSAECGMEESLM